MAEAPREALSRGDRVRMTNAAMEAGLPGPPTGTFIRYTRDGALIVLRNGLRTPSKYAPKFWQLDRARPRTPHCPTCGAEWPK